MAPKQRNMIALLALAACVATCAAAVIMLRSVTSTSTDRVVLVTAPPATRPAAKAAKRAKKAAAPNALVGGRPAVALMFVTLGTVEEQKPLWPGKFAPADGPWLARASCDSTVQSWLVDWQKKTSQGSAVTAEDRQKLSAALQDTPLDCVTLIELGKTVQFYTVDEETAGVFFAAAVQVGDKVLRGFEPGSLESRRIVVAISGGKGLLWRQIDGGNQKLVPCMSILNADLVHWIPPDDQTLNNFRLHGQIGMAECLYENGKIADALAISQAIDTKGLDDFDLAHVAWIRGISLFDAGRFAEAIPQLRIASTTGGNWSNRPDAQALLVLGLLNLNQVSEAQKEYQILAALPQKSAFLMQCKLTLAAALRRTHSPVVGTNAGT